MEFSVTKDPRGEATALSLAVGVTLIWAAGEFRDKNAILSNHRDVVHLAPRIISD